MAAFPVARLVGVALVIALAAPAHAVTHPRPIGPEAPPDLIGPGHVLTVGQIEMKVTNAGIVGNPFSHLSSDPSAQWPEASGVEYLNSIVFAVGATDALFVDPASRYRVSYGQEWGPASADFEDRIHTTADGAVNGSPHVNDDGDYDPIAGRPLIDEDFLDGRDNDGDGLIDEDHAALGQQMFSCVMRDDGPYAQPPVGSGHEPLVLECRQRAWAYDAPGYANVNVVEYTVINRSGRTLDSLTLGWRVDADLGPASNPLFFTDDRDLPGYPSAALTRVLDGPDPRRQHPFHPSVPVSPDSALCPRVPVRLNGFSFADDDGDGGATPGVATFLLVEHTVDPIGASAPQRVGFLSFRRFLAGTPYAAGGNPGTDAERLELMRSGEGVDPTSGFITVAPSGVAGDQVAWCSVGPFLAVPHGGSVRATVAFAVQTGDTATAADFAADVASFEAGATSGATLFAKHRPLANAWNAQRLYEGALGASLGQLAPDFHGRETPLIAPPGAPYFAADCRDLDNGGARIVSDLGHTWFDFDCDYCTGVWDYGTMSGRVERRWLTGAQPVGVEPAASGEARGPGLLTLRPAAPNPLVELSRLEFTLSRPARARIEVRDLAGRRVRGLGDERRAAGRHEVWWDGRDDSGRPAPTGVYYWTVSAGESVRSRTILILR